MGRRKFSILRTFLPAFYDPLLTFLSQESSSFAPHDSKQRAQR
jgi:hypothetical protein